MKTINCAECEIEYSYEPPVGYPDKRKYCANCSEKNKASFKHASESKPTHTPEGEPIETTTHGMKTKTSSGDNTDWEIGNRKVRCRALASAIEIYQKENYTKENILDLAIRFEQYILTGK